MTRALILPIGPLVSFDSNRLSDHNRAPIDIDYKPIEYKKRMVNGTLRRLTVANKRVFKLSWEKLPKNNNQTADGFWGAISIINFYKSNQQKFNLTLVKGDNSSEIIPVMFDSCSYKINSRSVYTDLYNIDLTLDEV